jgi:hypothetical protein
MILDKFALFADALAYGGTPEVLDTLNVKPGPGVPLIMFIGGESMAGVTGVTIMDKAASGDSLAARATVNFTATEMNDGPIQLEFPSNLKRYVSIDLIGTTTAGTYTAGISLAGIQTAR